MSNFNLQRHKEGQDDNNFIVDTNTLDDVINTTYGFRVSKYVYFNYNEESFFERHTS